MTTNQTKRLLLLLLSGVLLFSGCQLLPADSSPEVEANPPALPVDSAPGARDAAMLYIRDHYGLYVPPAGSAWNEQNLTPADVVSTSAFQFSLDHWIVNILFPTINPADIVYTISVHSPATGFAWEGLVDAHGNVTETRGYISPSSNNPANSPTIPPTSTSTTIPSLQSYRDTTYRFSLDYPSDWTLTVVSAGHSTASGGFSAKTVKLTKAGITLHIQYKFLWESTELVTELPSGPIAARGTVNLLGKEAIQQVVVNPAGKDILLFYEDSVDDMDFFIRLENGDEILPAEFQATAAQIVASMLRTGEMLPSPTGTATATPPPTPTATATEISSADATATAEALAGKCNEATFIEHVTLPPGTDVVTGTLFLKTWRVQNTGYCPWTPDYKLQYSHGDRYVGGDYRVYFTETIPPGATTDISVYILAPNDTGEYDNYWTLENSDDEALNIIINDEALSLIRNAENTLPMSANVVKPNNFAYNFAVFACYATWTNKPMTESGDSAKELPCLGKIGSSDGFITLISNPNMEHGADSNAALWVHPNAEYQGFVQGVFPKYRVQSGDRFRANVGCMADTPDCNLRFELYYKDAGGNVHLMGEWIEVYDKRIALINLDLSFLIGQEVQFILKTVSLTANTDAAQGFWLSPRIQQ
ncbi:MAG: hypothetical protein HN413_04095 [Chloroflexi bacterium]|mgnify:CR=1 FL=1|nr:hypothetical protein [Chloroflexota bacterium]